MPVAGILTTMFAGAASVALIDLAQTWLQVHGSSPLHAAMLFWPEFGGALAAAALFGAIFFTRYTPLLAFGGLVLIVLGGVLVARGVHGPDALIAVGSGCIGLGVGGSVSPALFISGFSLSSAQLPRVFSLIELLRGTAAFLAGPVVLHIAMTTAGGVQHGGLRIATWTALGLAGGGCIIVAAIWLAGGARLQRPDVERWLSGGGPAIESPALGERAARPV